MAQGGTTTPTRGPIVAKTAGPSTDAPQIPTGLNKERIQTLLQVEGLQFVRPQDLAGLAAAAKANVKDKEKGIGVGKVMAAAPAVEAQVAAPQGGGQAAGQETCLVVPFGEAEPMFSMELTGPQMSIVRQLPNLTADDKAFLMEHVDTLLGLIESGREIRGEESLRQAVGEIAAHDTVNNLNLSGVFAATVDNISPPGDTPAEARQMARRKMDQRNEEFAARLAAKDSNE